MRSKTANADRIKEAALLLLLGLVGLIGSYYLFTKAFSDEAMQSRVYGSKQSKTAKVASFLDLDAGPNLAFRGADIVQLKIEGKKVINEKITFSIDGFEQEKVFLLHTGDGTSFKMKDESVSFTYYTAGKFRIRLEELRPSGPTLVHTSMVNIYEHDGLVLSER